MIKPMCTNQSAVVDDHPKRIWEIDFLRGILIIGLVSAHIYIATFVFLKDGYKNINLYDFVTKTDPWGIFWLIDESGNLIMNFFMQNALFTTGVILLFFISGISSSLSKNNYKRGIKLLIFALILTLTSMLVSSIIERNITIRFGSIHCYAFSILLFELIRKKSNWLILGLAIIMITVGIYLEKNPLYMDGPWLLPFGIMESGVRSSGEYFPLFPSCGYLFIGGIVGKTIYKSKTSYCPWMKKQGFQPFCFLGRHTAIIYIGHILLIPLVLYSIGFLFHLF